MSDIKNAKGITEAPEVDPNEIPIEDLPVEVHAYKDENGYAIVLRSKDKRIGNSEGRLVDNFLVRILGGDAVPKVEGVHSVKVSDIHTRSVEVKDAKVDEAGRLFVTSAADGVQRPAAKDDEQK